MANKIIVLDFGSQYNQLIVRRIRDLGVYSELLPSNTGVEEIKNDKSIVGIIFSGGPNSVYESGSPSVQKEIFELGIPILGICYGMQLTAHMNGGKVVPCNKKEYGRADLKITNKCKLTNKLLNNEKVWMSHGDQVEKVPEGFVTNAKSSTCKNAMMSCEAKKIYCIQFHPEVQHTENGTQILKNFIFGICKTKADWTMESFIDREVKKIRSKVGKKKVLCALSGGVDSAVTAAIIKKAIGKQLICVFVDHGLLRKNEAENVAEVFKNHFKSNLIKIDAKKLFLRKLSRTSDPEKKRKIIGKLFIQTFVKHTKKLDNIEFLAQGTLYTDIIESGTSTAQTIKSHHNVGGLPKKMKLKLIEPLNTLFKDEVRVLGSKLGLPDHIVNRQPFPGPGLAIRVLGKVTKEKLRIVQETDGILHEVLIKHKLDKKIWQFFTALPNVRTVGVKGDGRSYDHVIVVRAVTSIDGMTADYAKIPYEILDEISTRMCNEVKGVGRVALDITSKPPATIEWE